MDFEIYHTISNVNSLNNIKCSKKKSLFCKKLNGKIMDFFLLYLIISFTLMKITRKFPKDRTKYVT